LRLQLQYDGAWHARPKHVVECQHHALMFLPPSIPETRNSSLLRARHKAQRRRGHLYAHGPRAGKLPVVRRRRFSAPQQNLRLAVALWGWMQGRDQGSARSHAHGPAPINMQGRIQLPVSATRACNSTSFVLCLCFGYWGLGHGILGAKSMPAYIASLTSKPPSGTSK
jgi:hypothetical protein